jgi:phospholipid/cholesterol/gamma-HCH transport system permease protein
MDPTTTHPAALTAQPPASLALSGAWTALGLGPLQRQIDRQAWPPDTTLVADASGIKAFDMAGAWMLQSLLQRLRASGRSVELQGLHTDHAQLLERVARQREQAPPATAAAPGPSLLSALGGRTLALAEQGHALLSFVGAASVAFAQAAPRPARWRWRQVLFNIRTAGFDALPIVGLLGFLLGIVIAYQGADQLRRYGANIFVVDLVGVSMLREFAPLITAIIVAGRSGSAYAAQLGTMSVTEEIDALKTLGVAPLELLVLPKIIALAIVMPLLTVYADLLGVCGGMLMARAQLGVSPAEFVDRFGDAVSLSSLMVGVAKAPVFAAVIAVVGCFQGLQTRGGADAVGRQTTRSVVQAIFGVIVADALFSVIFSALDL